MIPNNFYNTPTGGKGIYDRLYDMNFIFIINSKNNWNFEWIQSNTDKYFSNYFNIFVNSQPSENKKFKYKKTMVVINLLGNGFYLLWNSNYQSFRNFRLNFEDVKESDTIVSSLTSDKVNYLFKAPLPIIKTVAAKYLAIEQNNTRLYFNWTKRKDIFSPIEIFYK